MEHLESSAPRRRTRVASAVRELADASAGRVAAEGVTCPQCGSKSRVSEPDAFGGADKSRSTLSCGHVVSKNRIAGADPWAGYDDWLEAPWHAREEAEAEDDEDEPEDEVWEGKTPAEFSDAADGDVYEDGYCEGCDGGQGGQPRWSDARNRWLCENCYAGSRRESAIPGGRREYDEAADWDRKGREYVYPKPSYLDAEPEREPELLNPLNNWGEGWPEGHDLHRAYRHAAGGEGNSTTLPWNPEPQHPADVLPDEMTLAPEYRTDPEERLRPSDSVSFDAGSDPQPYPGPAPHLFAGGRREAGYPPHPDQYSPEYHDLLGQLGIEHEDADYYGSEVAYDVGWDGPKSLRTLRDRFKSRYGDRPEWQNAWKAALENRLERGRFGDTYGLVVTPDGVAHSPGEGPDEGVSGKDWLRSIREDRRQGARSAHKHNIVYHRDTDERLCSGCNYSPDEDGDGDDDAYFDSLVEPTDREARRRTAEGEGANWAKGEFRQWATGDETMQALRLIRKLVSEGRDLEAQLWASKLGLQDEFQREAARQRLAGDLVQGPLPAYVPGTMFNRPGEEAMYRLKYMNDPREHASGPEGYFEWADDYGRAEQEWLDAYRAEHPHDPDDADGVDDEDGYRNAGLSDKYVRLEAAVDHWSPVQQFRDDPHGFIERRGNAFTAGLDDPRMAEYVDLVEHDAGVRTAAWKDVREKAMRLRSEGRVQVNDVAEGRIYATVQGDHGTYEVTILKGASIGGITGNSIANWHCGCLWGHWAFKRRFTFVGRLCSHAYASYLTMQATPGNRSTRRPGPADAVIAPRPARDRYLPTFTYAASVAEDFSGGDEDDPDWVREHSPRQQERNRRRGDEIKMYKELFDGRTAGVIADFRDWVNSRHGGEVSDYAWGEFAQQRGVDPSQWQDLRGWFEKHPGRRRARASLWVEAERPGWVEGEDADEGDEYYCGNCGEAPGAHADGHCPPGDQPYFKQHGDGSTSHHSEPGSFLFDFRAGKAGNGKWTAEDRERLDREYNGTENDHGTFWVEDGEQPNDYLFDEHGTYRPERFDPKRHEGRSLGYGPDRLVPELDEVPAGKDGSWLVDVEADERGSTGPDGVAGATRNWFEDPVRPYRSASRRRAVSDRHWDPEFHDQLDEGARRNEAFPPLWSQEERKRHRDEQRERYRKGNCGDDEPVEDIHRYKGQDGNDYWADGPAKGTRPGSVAESWSKEKSAAYDADRRYYAKLAGLLEDLREIGDAGIEGDLGAMAERNDRVRDAVDAANEAGYDASQFVASAIRRYYAKGRHRVEDFAGSGVAVTDPYTGDDENGLFEGNPRGRGHWVDTPEAVVNGLTKKKKHKAAGTYGPYDVAEQDEPDLCECGKHYVTPGYGHDEYEQARAATAPGTALGDYFDGSTRQGRAVELPDASDEDLVLEMLRNRAPHGQVGDGDKGWDDEVVGEFGRRASWFGQLAAAPEPAEAAAGDHLPFNGSGNAPSLEFGSTDAWAEEHESAGLVDVTDLGDGGLPKAAKIVDVTDGDGVIKYSDDKAPQIERFAEFLPPGWGGNPSDPGKDESFPLPPGLGPVVDAVKALPLPLGELGQAVQAGQAASAVTAGTGPRAAKRIAGGSAPAQDFSADDIAANAQAFLRTAGRVYSAGEQRSLEEESHPLGARNLDGLELDGTHYLS